MEGVERQAAASAVPGVKPTPAQPTPPGTYTQQVSKYPGASLEPVTVYPSQFPVSTQSYDYSAMRHDRDLPPHGILEDAGGVLEHTAEAGANVVGAVGDAVSAGKQVVGELVSGAARGVGKVAEGIQSVTSANPSVLGLPLPKKMHRVQLRLGAHSVFRLSYLPTIFYDPVPATAGTAGMMMIVDPTMDPTRMHLQMDPSTVILPDMNRHTAKVELIGFRMPLPPIAQVRLNVIDLKGYAEVATGRVDLQMVGEILVISPFRTFPAIPVMAELTTEAVIGERFSVCGQRLKDGVSRTVAVALIPKSRSRLLNLLLGLPAESAIELEVFLELFGQTTTEARATQATHP